MNKTYPGVEGHATLMLDVIKAILEEPSGMIICDLMACEASITNQLVVNGKVYVDIQKHNIKNFEQHKDQFILMDSVEYLQSADRKFHATICLDGIEHISKDRGFMLLELMKKKSLHQIIFTPIGDFVVEPETTNPDGHKSGWLPEEFEKMGWATIVFPDFHKQHGTGAFFAYNHKDLQNQSSRVIHTLNQKRWTK